MSNASSDHNTHHGNEIGAVGSRKPPDLVTAAQTHQQRTTSVADSQSTVGDVGDKLTEKSRSVEARLLELLFKYKRCLQQQEYPLVAEREDDRRELAAIYDAEANLTQRILDAKVYLQLGHLQSKITDLFLADAIAPHQRFEMLAFIVRSVKYPLVAISGKGTLVGFHRPKIVVSEDTEVTTAASSGAEAPPPTVKARGLQDEDLRALAQRVKVLWRQCPDWPSLARALSIAEAEMLSQMVSRGEIKLRVELPGAPARSVPVALTVEGPLDG